jgi:hypothetical protein
MAKPILLSALATTIFWSTAILLAQEQLSAPVHKEGDTWQFNISKKGQRTSSTAQIEGTYELSITKGAVKLYEIKGSQKNEIRPMQELLFLIGKSEQQPGLRFPLSVGQKWTYRYQNRFLPGRRRSAEVNVSGIEQVTTPAGTFKAYKLIRSESWSVPSIFGGRGGSTSTYFYSPETRSIVKLSTASEDDPGTVETETELIKFTPGN